MDAPTGGWRKRGVPGRICPELERQTIRGCGAFADGGPVTFAVGCGPCFASRGRPAAELRGAFRDWLSGDADGPGGELGSLVAVLRIRRFRVLDGEDTGLTNPQTMNDSPRGIHHVTAIAGDAARNLAFYRDVLGLRLVKKTVNFDDPYTYHFYFGDEVGSPGTVLTFFPWANARPGRLGAGLIETVAFAVPSGALDFWRGHLQRANVAVSARAPVFGEPGIRFADPDGLQLELVETELEPPTRPWTRSIPQTAAIRAFHGAAQRVREAGPTDRFLRDVLGFQLVAETSGRRRYRTAASGVGVYDLVVDPTAARGEGGRGTVHHIAWATADADANMRWRERITAARVDVSPLMDRNYFRSIYFREPGGVLFEFATEGPGFAIDEPTDALGGALKLPDRYEGHRAQIEAALPQLPG